jgi:hypothetical protein
MLLYIQIKEAVYVEPLEFAVASTLAFLAAFLMSTTCLSQENVTLMHDKRYFVSHAKVMFMKKHLKNAH